MNFNLAPWLRENVAVLVGVIGVGYVMYQFIKTGELNTALLTTFAGIAGLRTFMGGGAPPAEEKK